MSLPKFSVFGFLYCVILILGDVRLTSGANDNNDSLVDRLSIVANDSEKVDIMTNIVRNLTAANEYDSAFRYNSKAMLLAKKIGYKQGVSKAYTNKGKLLSDQGNFPAAIKEYESALSILIQSTDQKEIANLYNLIANAYHQEEDYPQALHYQLAALKIREAISDEIGMAWSLNNIGTIYRIQGDYPAALQSYHTALAILEAAGDKKMVAIAFNNIGTVMALKGDYPAALDNYISSLKLREEIGDKNEIIAAKLNIGDTFCDLFEKDTSSNHVSVALDGEKPQMIARAQWLATALNILSEVHLMILEMQNTYYSIYSYSGLGRIWFLKQDFRKSINNYSKAYAIASEMDAVELQQEIAKYLADNYNKLGDFKTGISWYIRYTNHKDTLAARLNSEDLLRTRMKYEFDKKESETLAQQEKKDALAKSELDKQKKMRNLFQGGFVLVLLFAGVFFYQRNNIRKEKGRSENLLLNILPSEIASELKQTGVSASRSFDQVLVMFADFVDFTSISEKMTPDALVKELHTCFSAFDHIIQKYRIEKIKTIGDAYMCASGIPVADPEHAIQVMKAAAEIMEYVNARNQQKLANNEIPFRLRVGIHSGPVVAGIVGVKKYAYDIWGDTVNIAARMEQHSEPGKINISHSTYELVKDQYTCSYRGKIHAKHKGEIDMYFVES